MKSFEEIIDCLKEIFDTNSCSLRTHNNNIFLEETSKEATLKKIEIENLYQPFFAIKLDIYPKKALCKQFTNKTSKINQSCDCVIFTIFNNEPYIIFCEMKSSNPSKKDYLPQLQNSNCFIDFVNILLQEHYECNLNNFKRKYILFYRDKKTDEAVSLASFGGKVSNPDKVREKVVNKFVIKPQNIKIPLEKLLKK